MSYYGSGNKEIVCERFEPQTWRKTRCKNCFKTEPEHPLDVEPKVQDKEEIERQKAEKLNKLKSKFDTKSPAVPKKPTGTSNVLAKSPFAKFQEKEKEKANERLNGLKGKSESKVLSPTLKRKTSLDKGPFSPKLGAKNLGSPKLGTKPVVTSPKVGVKSALSDAKKKFEAKTEETKDTSKVLKKFSADKFGSKFGARADEKDSKSVDTKVKPVTSGVNGAIENKDNKAKAVGSPTEAKSVKFRSLGGRITDKAESKDAKELKSSTTDGKEVKSSAAFSKEVKSKVTAGDPKVTKDGDSSKKEKVASPKVKRVNLLRTQSREDKNETKEKVEDCKKDKENVDATVSMKPSLSSSSKEEKVEVESKAKENGKVEEKSSKETKEDKDTIEEGVKKKSKENDLKTEKEVKEEKKKKKETKDESETEEEVKPKKSSRRKSSVSASEDGKETDGESTLKRKSSKKKERDKDKESKKEKKGKHKEEDDVEKPKKSKDKSKERSEGSDSEEKKPKKSKEKKKDKEEKEKEKEAKKEKKDKDNDRDKDKENEKKEKKEKQEQKEKERKERLERKEQEKREKLERKEAERKEKEERREREKKEKEKEKRVKKEKKERDRSESKERSKSISKTPKLSRQSSKESLKDGKTSSKDRSSRVKKDKSIEESDDEESTGTILTGTSQLSTVEETSGGNDDNQNSPTKVSRKKSGSVPEKQVTEDQIYESAASVAEGKPSKVEHVLHDSLDQNRSRANGARSEREVRGTERDSDSSDTSDSQQSDAEADSPEVRQAPKEGAPGSTPQQQLQSTQQLTQAVTQDDTRSQPRPGDGGYNASNDTDKHNGKTRDAAGGKQTHVEGLADDGVGDKRVLSRSEEAEPTTRNRQQIAKSNRFQTGEDYDLICHTAGDSSSLNNSPHKPPIHSSTVQSYTASSPASVLSATNTDTEASESNTSSGSRSPAESEKAGSVAKPGGLQTGSAKTETGSDGKQESPTRLSVDVTKGEVRVKQLVTNTTSDANASPPGQVQGHISVSTSPSTSPSNLSNESELSRSDSVYGTPDSGLVTSPTNRNTVIKLDTRITSDNAKQQVHPASQTDISHDNRSEGIQQAKGGTTFLDSQENHFSNRNNVDKSSQSGSGGVNGRGSDINNRTYVQEVLGVHKPTGGVNVTASLSSLTASRLTPSGSDIEYSVRTSGQDNHWQDSYKQTREYNTGTSGIGQAPPKFGEPEIREDSNYSEDRELSRRRPLELRDRSTSGEASFLDDGDYENASLQDGSKSRRSVTAGTAGDYSSSPTSPAAAAGSVTSYREEGVTSFTDPDPEEDQHLSRIHHRVQDQNSGSFERTLSSGGNSYIRVDDSDNFLPHSGSTGSTSGSGSRQRRRHLEDDAEDDSRGRSRYQDSDRPGSTSPSSRASLYSRLDQLDADTSDSGDLLSPNSALYSCVSDLDTSAGGVGAGTSSSSGNSSTRSSYTYSPNTSSISPSNGASNTHGNTYSRGTHDTGDEELLDKSYSSDYHSNDGRNSRTSYVNDDSDDFEGTLTFTNRSRSGSLNDPDNDLDEELLARRSRWAALLNDDAETTDIPIVYSRRNEEEENAAEEPIGVVKDKEEEEEEYVPVYTPERLRELTGEDNFTFSGSGSGRRRRRRRNRGYTSDNTEYVGPRDRFMRMDDSYLDVSRSEAIMEGNRFLIEGLRERISVLECKIDRMDRDKQAMGNLLVSRREEWERKDKENDEYIEELADKNAKLDAENRRLSNRLKLPESEQKYLRDQENEIVELHKKLAQLQQEVLDVDEDNVNLRKEITDLHLEMEEMHDQFRDDEAAEFRELQKELEATAKNCRILQFKLRKVERRNDQAEADRQQYEEKVRQLESRFQGEEAASQIREMEEELRMAKEVSVRLHDELEAVEEKRMKAEDEAHRIRDYLREVENSRGALQTELQNLHNEVDMLRMQDGGKKSTLSIPDRKPGLGSIGKQSSGEYDMEKVMRDLSDSLERENDLKEQLKYSEQDLVNLRRRTSDLEDENESLNVQLTKMSSAKSPRHFKRGESTEAEHELRIQMELAEEESKVLKRKVNELEEERDELENALKHLEQRLKSPTPSTRAKSPKDMTYEDRIQSMSREIEDQHKRLAEKDREVERLLRTDKPRQSSGNKLTKSRSLDTDEQHSGRSRGKLTKSRSLDEDTIDLRRQLEAVEQEARVLKDKVDDLDRQNEKLIKDNRRLQLMAGRKVPSIQTDDSAMQNIELQNRLKTLEAENRDLRTKIKGLESKVTELSRGASQSLVKTQDKNMAELIEQMKQVEEEANTLRKKVSEVEGKNSVLSRKLKEAKGEEVVIEDVETDITVLNERLKELQCQTGDYEEVLRARDEEVERLEGEIAGYRDDIDNMFVSFQQREQELRQEMGVAEHKTQELYSKKIESLERLLKEERERAKAAEKKMEKRVEERQTAIIDDAKIWRREKDILQQELSLCQKQLKESLETLKEVKERLHKTQDAHSLVQKDYDKVSRQLDSEKKKKPTSGEKKDTKPEVKTVGKLGGAGVSDRPPASWRWEKQELERQIRELKKTNDEMHRTAKRRGSLTRQTSTEREEVSAGEKAGVPGGASGTGAAGGEDLKQLKTDKKELETKVKDMEKRQKQLSSDLDLLESDRKSSVREVTQFEEVVKQKDDLIKSKDELLQQKEQLLKVKDEALGEQKTFEKEKEALVKEKERLTKENKELKTKMEAEQKSNEKKLETEVKKVLDENNKKYKETEKELKEVKSKLQERETVFREVDSKIKTMEESVKQMDTQLKQKEDMLSSSAKALKDKETEVKDMDQSIRQAMKKIDEKDKQITTLKSSSEELQRKVDQNEKSKKEVESKFKKELEEQKTQLKESVELKEKLKKEVDGLKKEKTKVSTALHDIQKSVADKDIETDRMKINLESEIKKLKEKISRLDRERGSTKSPDSDQLQKLTQERDRLEKERDILTTDLKKLKLETDHGKKAWFLEREDLENTLKNLKKELQQKGPSTAASSTPSPSAGTTSQLEKQEIFFRAEKASIQELYEGKLRLLDEEVRTLQQQVLRLQKENSSQKELNNNVQRAMTDMKTKYDSSATSWAHARRDMQEKLEALEKEKEELDTVQQSIDTVKSELRKEQQNLAQLQSKMAAEKLNWAKERAELLQHIKKVEDAGSGPGARFRLREVTKRDSAKDDAEQKKLITEAKSMAQHADKSLERLQKAAQEDENSASKRLERERKEFQTEKKSWKEKDKQLEEGTVQISTLQRKIIDLQYKLQSERETWLREKGDMQRHLDHNKQGHLQDQHVINELQAEVKKHRALLGVAVGGSSSGEVGIKPSSSPGSFKASAVIELSAGSGSSSVTTRSRSFSQDASATLGAPHSSTFRLRGSSTSDQPYDTYPAEAERESRHTEATNQIQNVKLRERNSSAPPKFRRSLSTSEVEMFDDMDYLPPHTVAIPVYALSPSAGAAVSVSAPISGPVRMPDLHPANTITTSGSTTSSSFAEDHGSRISRARQVLTRSFSSSKDIPQEGGTLGRRSRHSTMTRSSLHQTGTQSAYSSRDASPEKGFRFRKLSPYPAPPPSIMIAPTPPRTPRRSPIPGSGVSLMTSGAMTKLYAKLAAIERVENEREDNGDTSDLTSESQAIVAERTGRVRILTKSVSVDSSESEPQYVPAHLASDLSDVPERRSIYGRYAEEYEDAPISQTLPASIRIGELTITPGIEALSKTMTPDLKRATFGTAVGSRSESRRASQHKIERKKFFENYPTDVKELQKAEVKSFKHEVTQKQLETEEKEEHAQLEPQKTASKPFFFTSVKERRKLFSGKKSQSVDASSVQSGVAKMGVALVPPAVPSANVPLEVKVKSPHSTSSSASGSKHKRAASVDIPLSADIIPTSTAPDTSPVSTSSTGTGLTSWLARKISSATGSVVGGGGTMRSSDKEKSSSASKRLK